MKQLLFCLFILLFTTKVRPQDTICFTDKSKTAAIVKKITPNEVEYLKYNNPNGLVITENKSVIKYIRYQDGTVDSIKVYPLPSSTQYYEFESINNKLFIDKNNLIYKSIVLNNQNLKVLINSYPFEGSRNEMNVFRKKARVQKNISLIFAGIAVMSTYSFLYGINKYTRTKTTGNEGTVFLAGTGAALTGSVLLYLNFRKKEIKAKREIERIYNQMK